MGFALAVGIMNDSLDHLTARMCEGDKEALGQVFLTLQPELQRVLRRQLTAPLRSKLDPADIILATWTDVLRTLRESRRRFASAGHFRRFLFVLARHRLIDYVRRHRKELEREQPIDEAEHGHRLLARDPAADEVAQAVELWERIVGLCPPEHVPVVVYRREGYTPSEIAARTGLHVDSIRRILRTLARRLTSEGRGRALGKSAPGSGPKSR
jgi:RNA polymerase sigma factor (sigma-70 family)